MSENTNTFSKIKFFCFPEELERKEREAEEQRKAQEKKASEKRQKALKEAALRALKKKKQTVTKSTPEQSQDSVATPEKSEDASGSQVSLRLLSL